MINALFFILCLMIGCSSHLVYGSGNIHKEDLELEKQLKLVNKPSVKSIHTKFGYIVDCIDINKQPAFDHPLLKNHKLQLKPSLQKSSRETIVKNSTVKSIFGLHKVQCPTGTVPIRRTMKDDLIRSKILNNHMLTQDVPGHHFAEVLLKTVLAPYYGVSGTNTVYNPRVERNDQFSASHLRIQNGQKQAADLITLGWHVDPGLYGGDKGTYLYSSWRNNLKKTGCYNILCPGFVQTHQGLYLGGRVEKTSVYGGLMKEYAFSIFQDERTKNWWINVQDQNIGYFPAALFSNMSSADLVGWGGLTGTPRGTASPPMGSGYLPDENFYHACYFRKIGYQNGSRKSYGPEEFFTFALNDKPDCFQAQNYGDRGGDLGYCLQFGGPGGNCGD